MRWGHYCKKTAMNSRSNDTAIYTVQSRHQQQEGIFQEYNIGNNLFSYYRLFTSTYNVFIRSTGYMRELFDTLWNTAM